VENAVAGADQWGHRYGARSLRTAAVCILPAVQVAMYAIAHADTSPSPSSELTWDNGCGDKTISGTVAIPDGSDSHWSPSLLLATSVGASLLSTFLNLAQRVHLPLLGLATHQSIELDARSDVPAVIVTACITVPTKQAGRTYRMAAYAPRSTNLEGAVLPGHSRVDHRGRRRRRPGGRATLCVTS
jgi:hypothetical protein